MSFSSNLSFALIRKWTEFLFKKWTWARNQLKNYSPVTHVGVKQSDRSRLRNTHKPERKNEGKASSRFEIYTLKQFFAGCSVEDDKLGGGGEGGESGRCSRSCPIQVILFSTNLYWSPLMCLILMCSNGVDGFSLNNPGCKENHFYTLPFGQAEASIY